MQWNDALPHHPLPHYETGQAQETVNHGRILQSAPEDTTAIQFPESTDPLDTLLPFSRRRVRADESPINTKRRHME